MCARVRACAAPHLLQGLVLGRGGRVVGVLVGAQRQVGGRLADHLAAVLLVLVGQLLDVAVRFARAQAPHGAGQPLAQRVARPLGPRGGVGPQGVAGARLQGVVAGDGQRVWGHTEGFAFRAFRAFSRRFGSSALGRE